MSNLPHSSQLLIKDASGAPALESEIAPESKRSSSSLCMYPPLFYFVRKRISVEKGEAKPATATELCSGLQWVFQKCAVEKISS
ncbi:hypothetical protein RRG08_038808 [Elysia crispata]|uniref:Uncharacterized protein n=1 Tax=Elysia crispata TaxID=231223 RepID=A0AAE1D4L1_9GAST|nr:hypothetical protein RRG08_038808 [Elysia crispata]